jgi:endonuclease VIII
VHGLHPYVPIRDMDRANWDPMWATLVESLRRWVRDRHIMAVDPKEISMPRSRMRRTGTTSAHH